MQQSAPTQPVIIKESAQSKKERRFHIFLHIGLIIYFAITLLPFVWTFMTSLKQSKDVAAAPLKIFFEPTLDNFKLVETTLPSPAPGQLLLRSLYLSLDPYMRGRMSTAKSYAAPWQVGDVLQGATVCEVATSITVTGNQPTATRANRAGNRRAQSVS